MNILKAYHEPASGGSGQLQKKERNNMDEEDKQAIEQLIGDIQDNEWYCIQNGSESELEDWEKGYDCHRAKKAIGGLMDKVKLLHGDCLELMKDIPDKSVDMVLCDLPYGTTQNKWDSIIPLEPLWEQYERIIKDRGAIILTAQTPFDKVLGVSNLKLLRYEWIWDKRLSTGHLNAKKMPMKRHENILVFYKKLPTYNPQMTEGEPYDKGYGFGDSSNYGKQRAVSHKNDTGLRYPTSILDHSNANRRGKVHPTQKPVALIEYLIKTYTNEGETVLDNCMGSGSTGVACVNTNRNFIGIELDDEYFQIAKERVQKALADREAGI